MILLYYLLSNVCENDPFFPKDHQNCIKPEWLTTL